MLYSHEKYAYLKFILYKLFTSGTHNVFFSVNLPSRHLVYMF